MNRKKRNIFFVTVLFLTLLTWSVSSLGQVLKGSISGTVKDPQGAVVSGAQVKATHVETGTVQQTKTDNSGTFHFQLIPTGTYKVEVTQSGFKTAVQNNVQVAAGVASRIGVFNMALAEPTTSVDANTDALLIESTQAQVPNRFHVPTLSTLLGI